MVTTTETMIAATAAVDADAREQDFMRAIAFVGVVTTVFSCGTSLNGERDCSVLASKVADPATSAACTSCQAVACAESGCEIFPCVNGSRVVQGCEADADCSELKGTQCGQHSAPDHVCSTHPDNL